MVRCPQPKRSARDSPPGLRGSIVPSRVCYAIAGVLPHPSSSTKHLRMTGPLCLPTPYRILQTLYKNYQLGPAHSAIFDRVRPTVRPQGDLKREATEHYKLYIKHYKLICQQLRRTGPLGSVLYPRYAIAFSTPSSVRALSSVRPLSSIRDRVPPQDAAYCQRRSQPPH